VPARNVLLLMCSTLPPHQLVGYGAKIKIVYLDFDEAYGADRVGHL
jgi:hypothetical protein